MSRKLSTELSQHVKQYVLASGHSERWVSILDSTFFISGLHTFPFGLHILVGLHASIFTL